jgi:uncharacterized RDD family membrane protein YckC
MTTNVWYYVDRHQQRQGPIDAEIIREAYRGGQIGGESLVWREGMAQWAPLKQFELEFDLEDEPASLAMPAAPTLQTGPAVSSIPGYAQPPVATSAGSPYAPPTANLVGHYQPVDDGPVVYAGFWRRYAASMIDGLIFGAIIVVLMLVLFGIGGVGMRAFTYPNSMSGGFAIAFLLVFYVLPIVLQAVYFTWMHASEGQATLGKRAVGIKVASRGERLTMGRSFGRWAAYFFLNLFSCGLTTLVSGFMVGLTERKQGLHDMMVDTTVVDRWAYTEFPERQRDELGGVTIAMIVLSVLGVLGYIAAIAIAISMAPQH